MPAFPDIYLRFEQAMLATVFCSHCDERLGRLEMFTGSGTGEPPSVREKEIEGELQLLIDEHRDVCEALARHE